MSESTLVFAAVDWVPDWILGFGPARKFLGLLSFDHAQREMDSGGSKWFLINI